MAKKDTTEITYTKTRNIVIDNAKIIFRNFSGRESKYNPLGNRNFCVFIDNPDLVSVLSDDGWNIRILAPRDETEDARHYMQVTVSFKKIEGIPEMKIYMHCNGVETEMTEQTVDSLDYAEIQHVDLTIRPYDWNVNGKVGVKGYLKTMHVTIESDEWAEKYASMEAPEEDPLPFE